jgi:hypothetical protein
MARYLAKENRDPYYKEEKLSAENLIKGKFWRVCMKTLQGTSKDSCRGNNIETVVSELREEPGILHRDWTSRLCQNHTGSLKTADVQTRRHCQLKP